NHLAFDEEQYGDVGFIRQPIVRRPAAILEYTHRNRFQAMFLTPANQLRIELRLVVAQKSHPGAELGPFVLRDRFVELADQLAERITRAASKNDNGGPIRSLANEALRLPPVGARGEHERIGPRPASWCQARDARLGRAA